ncbi:MAG: hypothetical protein AB8G05_00740 [Oligoflexales bacterium]
MGISLDYKESKNIITLVNIFGVDNFVSMELENFKQNLPTVIPKDTISCLTSDQLNRLILDFLSSKRSELEHKLVNINTTLVPIQIEKRLTYSTIRDLAKLNGQSQREVLATLGYKLSTGEKLWERGSALKMYFTACMPDDYVYTDIGGGNALHKVPGYSDLLNFTNISAIDETLRTKNVSDRHMLLKNPTIHLRVSTQVPPYKFSDLKVENIKRVVSRLNSNQISVSELIGQANSAKTIPKNNSTDAQNTTGSLKIGATLEDINDQQLKLLGLYKELKKTLRAMTPAQDDRFRIAEAILGVCSLASKAYSIYTS